MEICKFDEIPQTFSWYISFNIIAEVLNDQNLFTESKWANWFSSCVQFLFKWSFLRTR